MYNSNKQFITGVTGFICYFKYMYIMHVYNQFCKTHTPNNFCIDKSKNTIK